MPRFYCPCNGSRHVSPSLHTANIEILKSFGNKIIEPQTGELASGLSGPGRMEEPDKILEVIHDFFLHSGDLKGKTVLVTAGPTFERLTL